MGTDRIDMVEGVVDDLAQGRAPNVPAEMGARAEWQHNRVGFLLKAVAAVAIGGTVLFVIRGEDEPRREDQEPAQPSADELARVS